MQQNKNIKGKRLTYDDRKNIQRWFKNDKSNQTSNNEIKRGLVDLTYNGDGMPCFKTIYNRIYKCWINGLSKKDLIYTRKPKPIYKKLAQNQEKKIVYLLMIDLNLLIID